MSRTLLALLAAAGSAARAAQPQLVEGMIALTRFGQRVETVGGFLIQDGPNMVPFRVPKGGRFTIRQVTATCSVQYGGMNFWTVRSSAATAVHHYLPISTPIAGQGNGVIWVSTERVRVPVPSGEQPVATFQRWYSFGSFGDACVGSWSGTLQTGE